MAVLSPGVPKNPRQRVAQRAHVQPRSQRLQLWLRIGRGLLAPRRALAAARGVYGSLATRDEQDDSEGQDDEQPPPAPEPAFLVTDAPEVQGASGGPLIDCDGRVVGINTYVLSAGEAHTRYYALSARRAVEAANDILLWRQSIGKRKRGWR